MTLHDEDPERERAWIEARTRPSKVKVYVDLSDWWIGYYRGPNHHYVCILPTLVLRWPRANPASPEVGEYDFTRQHELVTLGYVHGFVDGALSRRLRDG